MKCERINDSLARVLLEFNLPFKRYPESGVWCYLIKTREGIVVFDAGPKYISWLPYLRKFSKKTKNIKFILSALKKYFPGKPVSAIILSHWHFDHSEIAPGLQDALHKKQGYRPPIKIHKRDFEKKRFFGTSQSLGKVFKDAGYSHWKIELLKEHEKFGDFVVRHVPGHTSGTIALENKKDKVLIIGWWVKPVKNFFVRNVLRLINEQNESIKNSVAPFHKGYQYYFFHPKYISIYPRLHS